MKVWPAEFVDDIRIWSSSHFSSSSFRDRTLTKGGTKNARYVDERTIPSGEFCSEEGRVVK